MPPQSMGAASALSIPSGLLVLVTVRVGCLGAVVLFSILAILAFAAAG
jgi:hypothetical protein